MSYKDEFLRAASFSASRNYALDAPLSQLHLDGSLQAAVHYCATFIEPWLEQLDGLGFDKFRQFGVECANVHVSMLDKMHKLFPGIAAMANLTIGEFELDGKTEFSLTQDDFLAWSSEEAPTFSGHTWLTIGYDYILDLTGATYLNTRIRSVDDFGGLIKGRHDEKLDVFWPYDMRPERSPLKMKTLTYHPVVVGRQALHAKAPRRIDGQ